MLTLRGRTNAVRRSGAALLAVGSFLGPGGTRGQPPVASASTTGRLPAELGDPGRHLVGPLEGEHVARSGQLDQAGTGRMVDDGPGEVVDDEAVPAAQDHDR